MKKLLLLLALFSLPAIAGFDQFIRVEGTKLMEGDKEFRFLSYNVPTLNYVEDEMSFEQSNKTSESLNHMLSGLNKINDMARVIATAVEQQSSVAKELSANVNEIYHISEITLNDANKLSEATDVASGLALEQRQLAEQFLVNS